jgi:uncharacterized protein (DUF433 family)
MSSPQTFVPVAEAAFIAGLSAPQMNRLVDEDLVPDTLLVQDAGARKFARLSAAFARFFFETESDLVASTRRRILLELTRRIEGVQARDAIFALHGMPLDVDWKVFVSRGVTVDVSPFISATVALAKEVDNADKLIVEDDDVLGGMPCFAGTRVPIENVLASLDKGVDRERVLKSYPFLTEAHIDAARVYSRVHPRRGRPRRLSDSNAPALKRVSKVVRTARA